MASTVAKPLGEPSSGAATFSYAQAAKGRATSTSASTVQSSQATSGANTPSKEPASFTDTPSGSINGTGVFEGDRSAKLNGDIATKLASSDCEVELKPSTVDGSSTHSLSFGTSSASTLAKEDISSAAPKFSSDSPWDRPKQTESSNERSSEVPERKKGKKARKDRAAAEKEAEAEKEEVKPEILIAAPPPAVNIWQQRKEAQAAKVKVTPQTTEAPQFSDANTNGTTVSLTTKSSENRKKGKVGVEDEKSTSTGLVNGGKENQQPSAKGPKKGEGNTRSKEDTNGKTRAPRGGRLNDKDEKTTTNQLPPPVEDAISWPTPETALEEEKRKAQEKAEKEEKDENAPNKPRPKEKWVSVPYVPSVNFNTPLPTRGGRGGRGGGRGGAREGGRSGHAPNSSVSGEKTFTSAAASNNAGNDGRERGRDNTNNSRATSLPPNSSKRNPGEGVQDQRKVSAIAFEKAKADSSSVPAKGEHNTRDQRRSSIVQQAESNTVNQASSPSGADARFGRTDGPNGVTQDSHGQSRSGGPDRRGDSNGRNDFGKDTNGHAIVRDRGEGRSERGGRGGGFRGRGGHNNFTNGQPHPQHLYTNGHTPPTPNAYSMRQNLGPYSPPIQQQQFASPYPPPNGAIRGNRNSLPQRAQSIPTNNVYGAYRPNMPPGSHQMAPLQTNGSAMFDYPNNVGLNAAQYSYAETTGQTLALMIMQMEYYFSIDNLCKDVFLRKHMDGQGFVLLSFIANFKRVKALTDDYQLLRIACHDSEFIEIIQGEDGLERVRRLEGWEQWVLAVEDRDVVARNSGPQQHYPLNISQRPQPMMSAAMPPLSAMSAPPFSPNGIESSFQQYPNGPINPTGFEHTMFQQSDTPLSAAVPDFAPKLQSNGNSELESLQAETTFTDEEFDNLQLVWNEPESEDAKPPRPFQGASARTFSDGSIDMRSIAGEIMGRPGRTLANGTNSSSEMSPDRLKRSKSPYQSSPTVPISGNAPAVMWAKGQNQQVPISETSSALPYNVLHERAIQRRDSSALGVTHHDMKLLYGFWSHFLVRNFNPRMYVEFRSCAFDDANRRQDTTGMKHLVQFYDETLNSKKKTIPEIFAKHYIELVKAEDPAKERPGFTKLRAAWRNGALDMKSRKKVDNLIDFSLRAELER